MMATVARLMSAIGLHDCRKTVPGQFVGFREISGIARFFAPPPALPSAETFVTDHKGFRKERKNAKS
jgi:hypothetical protein